VGSVSSYLRQNVLGVVAIFLALNAGAYAVTTNDAGSAKTVFNQDLGNSSVDSRVIADGGVEGIDIHSAAVGPKKLKLDQLVKYLQTRVNATCAQGQTIQGILADGSVICADDQVNAGTITGIATSGGLTGGGTAGDVSLGIDLSAIQRRVAGSCTGTNAVQSVAQDGTVVCQPTGTGTVTSVGSGTGLSGGPITTSGTLSVNPAQVQSRVTGTCSGNNAVQSVAQAGTVVCQPTGTVTSVGSGTGLMGGPVTTSGTLSVDPTQEQTRVSGTCSGTTALQNINQNGGVSCSQSLQTAGHVLTPNELEINSGTSAPLFSANGILVTAVCTAATNPEVTIGPTGNTTLITYAANSAASSNAHYGLEVGSPTAPETISVGTGGLGDHVYFDAFANNGTGNDKTLSGSFQSFPVTGGPCVFSGTAEAS
jgi:hypothetical protein